MNATLETNTPQKMDPQKGGFAQMSFINSKMAIEYIRQGIPKDQVLDKFLRSLGYVELAEIIR